VSSLPVCSCVSCPAHPNGSPQSPGRPPACGFYPNSSMTDAQWAVIEPLLPAPGNTGGRGGRPEKHPRRLMLDAIFYVVTGGVAWAALPHDFPPSKTVYGLFTRWTRAGAWQRLHDGLRDLVRVHEGRDPNPTAAIIDSQSVRGADTVPTRSRGYDAGKRVNGRKRHIAVDTGGLLLVVLVTVAGLHDRDAAHRLLTAVRARFCTVQAGLGRRWLRRTPGPLGCPRSRARRRDRQTHRRPGGVPRAAPPLGGGAHLRLDQQTPPLRARLRDPPRPSRSHDPPRHDQDHVPTAGPHRRLVTRENEAYSQPGNWFPAHGVSR
jgi:transposase